MAYYGLWNLSYNDHLKGQDTGSPAPTGGPPPEIASRLLPGYEAYQDENGTWHQRVKGWTDPTTGQHHTSIGGIGLHNLVPQGDGYTGVRDGENYLFGRRFTGMGGGGSEAGDLGFQNWLSSPYFAQALRYAQTLNPDIGGVDWSSMTMHPMGRTPLSRNSPNITGIPNFNVNPPPSNGPGIPSGNPGVPNTTVPGNGPISRVGNNGPSLANVVQKGGAGAPPAGSPLSTATNKPAGVPNGNPLSTATNKPAGVPNGSPINKPAGPGSNSQVNTNDPQQNWNNILQNRDPYGSIGQFGTSGLDEQRWSQLPDWLRNQFRRVEGSEDGRVYYELPSGGVKLPDGRTVYPVGNASMAIGGEQSDGSIIDWSRVEYHPELGMVTDSLDNIRQVVSDHHRIGRGLTLAGIAAMAMGAGWYALNNGVQLAPAAAEAASTAATQNPSLWQQMINGFSEFGSSVVQSITQGATGWEAVINGVKYIWDGVKWVSAVLGVANTVSQLTGNGSLYGSGRTVNNNNNGNSGNNNGSSGDSLIDLLTSGLGLHNDNRDIQRYWAMVRGLLDESDYNRQYRGDYLSRLHNFMMNPEGALQDPTFRAVREQNLGNLSRTLNARGYNLSGNEFAALQQRGQELDWQQIEKERNALRQAATLGNPESIYRSALSSLPQYFQMRANRNAGLNTTLQRLFGGQNGNAIERFIRNWFGSNSGNSIDDLVNDLIAEFPEIDRDLLDPILDDPTIFRDYFLDDIPFDFDFELIGDDDGSELLDEDFLDWLFGGYE